MKKPLTDIFVRSVQPPASGRLEIADARCVGLTLRVTHAGVKSWSLRFRDPTSGKLTRATIGDYPTSTLQMARERALDLKREIASGINPVEKKRRDRATAATRTFQTLADRYIVEHARRHKRTASADERSLRRHILPEWAKRPYNGIGRGDVIALCESVVSKGWPIQANRVQALISKIFSFAIDAELVAVNPCTRLKKRSKEVIATRVLADAEIRLFWSEIGKSPNSARIGQALRLVLLTGVRVNEIAGAEIREFERLDDSELATWTIPAARSKNGRAHVVPLSPLALDIVNDLLRIAEIRETTRAVHRFLLASPVDPRKPIDGHALSVAMGRFGKSLESKIASRRKLRDEGTSIASWVADRPSAHDLRRTLATRLAGSGLPAEDIAACLNHVRRGVTAMHYDHYDRAREKRAALMLWADQIERLTSGANDPSKLNRVNSKLRTPPNVTKDHDEPATSDS
jgi:integrase